MVKHKTLHAYVDPHWDKAHEKDPDHFKYARFIIYAPSEEDLHEITLTYINTLNYNGAWDFQVSHDKEHGMNTVTFKYNGGIQALNVAQRLHFHCAHKICWNWNYKPTQ